MQPQRLHLPQLSRSFRSLRSEDRNGAPQAPSQCATLPDEIKLESEMNDELVYKPKLSGLAFALVSGMLMWALIIAAIVTLVW